MIPEKIQTIITAHGLTTLRPAQIKAIDAGLFDFKNILVCTPTGSGKTYVAELAFLNAILHSVGKAIYVVPLKALANEKYKDFQRKYSDMFRIALSIGDSDSADNHIASYDLIITTAEKLDSLIRHHAPWLSEVKTVIIDEIHLLNDSSRGPTLEVVITILRKLLNNMQLIGLSATIGNAQELANWLQATLVADSWRPVALHKGILFNDTVEFFS